MRTKVASNKSDDEQASTSETLKIPTFPSQRQERNDLLSADIRQRQQRSTLFSRENEYNDSDSRRNRSISDNQKINYWHYKQTGIKSRPIKLLKHPIEHIERKIIFSYLIGFLFRLIAIFTGPLIVLVVYLITVPFIISRRSIWFLLNLACICDARIKTTDSSIVDDSDLSQNAQRETIKYNFSKKEKQIYWNYCPLSYIESYWFKEKLVNNVILVIDNKKSDFSIEKLRSLVKENILSKPSFRKFLSRVVDRGLPFYKSQYWYYLGLANDGCCESDLELTQSSKNLTNDHVSESRSTITTSTDQFPITSVTSKISRQNVEISMPPNLGEDINQVYLSNHIYIDQSLQGSQDTYSSIRRYAYTLLEVSLNMTRPLWEFRLLPTANGRFYLIFRCHQSLADGRSLSKILTDNLTVSLPFESSQISNIRLDDDIESISDQKVAATNKECEDENQLKPMREKKSFISKISKTNSLRSAVFVGPLTVLLWVIWTFTRKKSNHLNKCLPKEIGSDGSLISNFDDRRFYMTHYSLTKFHQIKQMTRSTVSDVILCALSGALRDYLRKYNGVSNPPNLNISLTVDMRRSEYNCDHHKRSDHPEINRISSFQSRQLANLNESIYHHSNTGQVPQVNCTLVNVSLPTSVEGAIPRLWELRNTMDELRSSADPWVMLSLQKFLFTVLPSSWYQWVINFIALRNSSTFVSNIRGPQNMVEAWCVDLLQRAIIEAQQPPRTFQPHAMNSDMFEITAEKLIKARSSRARATKTSQLEFMKDLGSISAIYYCMQPPTSNIPISFNCITYHNKLFVTSLSRSLLVEDSKLLISLFFRQLNQLANTIAKRKSLVTIVRTPVPIEISCQPASPVSKEKSPIQTETVQNVDLGNEDMCLEQEVVSEKILDFRSTSGLFGDPKDDMEANKGRTNRCHICQQSICTCRRRKSLFNFDSNKQRTVNLLSLLHPSHFTGMRTSRSNENQEKDVQQNTIECVCGQKLLKELDDDFGNYADGEDKETSSVGSMTPSEEGIRLRRLIARPCCSKCRLIIERSTQSLNARPGNTKINHKSKHWLSQFEHTNNYQEQNIKYSDISVDCKRGTHSSVQLIVPQGDEIYSKDHSKSETDLLPRNLCGKSKIRKGLRESWFIIGRRSYKPSMISRSVDRSRAGVSHMKTRSTISPTKSRNFKETSVEFNDYHRNPSKRRQSVATSVGTSHIQRSVVVKDEINEDVNLRYHLDGSFLGIRNRRFSTIGSAAVGNQRRASLIPFGLMHNQSLPKLFWTDSETYL